MQLVDIKSIDTFCVYRGRSIVVLDSSSCCFAVEYIHSHDVFLTQRYFSYQTFIHSNSYIYVFFICG